MISPCQDLGAPSELWSPRAFLQHLLGNGTVGAALAGDLHPSENNYGKKSAGINRSLHLKINHNKCVAFAGSLFNNAPIVHPESVFVFISAVIHYMASLTFKSEGRILKK